MYSVRESAVQVRRSLHYLVKCDVMISGDVYGPFFRDVATDPQRIADRHVGPAVRYLRRPVLVRDRRLARVHRHRTLGVHVRRVRYDHRGANVVLICKSPHAGTRGFD